MTSRSTWKARFVARFEMGTPTAVRWLLLTNTVPGFVLGWALSSPEEETATFSLNRMPLFAMTRS